MWSRLFSPAAPFVRALSVTDSAAVAALHAEGFARPWSAEDIAGLIVDSAVVGQAIGRKGRAPDGFVLSRIAADEAEILTIATSRGMRGRGLAATLLQHHLGQLAARGVTTLFLEVDEGNEAARRLYDRFGFAEVGRRAGYYRKADGSSATALILRRDVP